MSQLQNVNRIRELNLDWITNPPIVELTTEQQAAEAVKNFSDNMRGWDEVYVPTNQDYLARLLEEAKKRKADRTFKGAGPDTYKLDWKTPKRTQQEAWNDRLENTRTMLDSDFSDDYTIAYRVQGAVVGILAMKEMTIPYITELVTHPGTDGAGGILVECAVQKSVEWGKNGVVDLWALNEDAKVAYEFLGFASIPGEKEKSMRLDPAKSPRWSNLNGVWRLAKYKDATRYAT